MKMTWYECPGHQGLSYLHPQNARDRKNWKKFVREECNKFCIENIKIVRMVRHCIMAVGNLYDDGSTSKFSVQERVQKALQLVSKEENRNIFDSLWTAVEVFVDSGFTGNFDTAPETVMFVEHLNEAIRNDQAEGEEEGQESWQPAAGIGEDDPLGPAAETQQSAMDATNQSMADTSDQTHNFESAIPSNENSLTNEIEITNEAEVSQLSAQREVTGQPPREAQHEATGARAEREDGSRNTSVDEETLGINYGEMVISLREENDTAKSHLETLKQYHNLETLTKFNTGEIGTTIKTLSDLINVVPGKSEIIDKKITECNTAVNNIDARLGQIKNKEEELVGRKNEVDTTFASITVNKEAVKNLEKNIEGLETRVNEALPKVTDQKTKAVRKIEETETAKVASAALAMDSAMEQKLKKFDDDCNRQVDNDLKATIKSMTSKSWKNCLEANSRKYKEKMIRLKDGKKKIKQKQKKLKADLKAHKEQMKQQAKVCKKILEMAGIAIKNEKGQAWPLEVLITPELLDTDAELSGPLVKLKHLAGKEKPNLEQSKATNEGIDEQEPSTSGINQPKKKDDELPSSGTDDSSSSDSSSENEDSSDEEFSLDDEPKKKGDGTNVKKSSNAKKREASREASSSEVEVLEEFDNTPKSSEPEKKKLKRDGSGSSSKSRSTPRSSRRHEEAANKPVHTRLGGSAFAPVTQRIGKKRLVPKVDEEAERLKRRDLNDLSDAELYKRFKIHELDHSCKVDRCRDNCDDINEKDPRHPDHRAHHHYMTYNKKLEEQKKKDEKTAKKTKKSANEKK